MRAKRILAVAALLLMTAACSGNTAELDALKAERDALEAQLAAVETQRAAVETRHELSSNTQQQVADIIADPGAFGDKMEVLNALAALATADAVMDDTAFGAVEIRRAWASTIYDTNSTIKTWATWLSDDGATGGSMWTWAGTAQNGEPFELIGINIDRFDENGLLSHSVVDWPYPGDTVRSALATGGPD
jgi:hypothetical protein